MSQTAWAVGEALCLLRWNLQFAYLLMREDLVDRAWNCFHQLTLTARSFPHNERAKETLQKDLEQIWPRYSPDSVYLSEDHMEHLLAREPETIDLIDAMSVRPLKHHMASILQ